MGECSLVAETSEAIPRESLLSGVVRFAQARQTTPNFGRFAPPTSNSHPRCGHDIFEGTEQIQQLVISRAISGMRIE